MNITFDYFRDYRDRILMKRASFGKLLVIGAVRSGAISAKC
ncbi:MAG: hypothetical protein ACLR6J_11665 [Parabacteroides merdae]